MSACFLILEGSAKLAPGRVAIATTTRGLASQMYSTPEWVAEDADVRDDTDRSCTPSGVRMFWISNRGCSSLSLLDPRLMSVIPTGIKTCCFPIRQSSLGFGPGEFEDFHGGENAVAALVGDFRDKTVFLPECDGFGDVLEAFAVAGWVTAASSAVSHSDAARIFI